MWCLGIWVTLVGIKSKLEKSEKVRDLKWTVKDCPMRTLIFYERSFRPSDNHQIRSVTEMFILLKVSSFSRMKLNICYCKFMAELLQFHAQLLLLHKLFSRLETTKTLSIHFISKILCSTSSLSSTFIVAKATRSSNYSALPLLQCYETFLIWKLFCNFSLSIYFWALKLMNLWAI